MKKYHLIIFILILFLAGCKPAGPKEVLKGINIFSQDGDLVLDFVPEAGISLKELGDKDYKYAAILSNTGQVTLIEGDLYLDKEKSVFASDGKGKIENIEGIFLTDNFFSVTDAYYQMSEYLKRDEKVMTVLLDGFSYKQFTMAREKGIIPFLSKNFLHPALSVYIPVTNAGYAAVITGKTPDINGVHDRSVRQMQVDSIFNHALETNKKPILLEGDIKILNTEIEPELHIDLNNNGDTDDEMYERVLTACQENYDLIFIHFHGLDDRGHTYGPYSNEAMNYLMTLDKYLLELSRVWEGNIIIVPDHGMHETSEGGGHGICSQSDMVVPYFIREK